MPVTAKFGADFAAFERAVQQANVSLRGFQSEAGKVEKSLNRMVDNFSGRKLVQDATLMTEAVSRVGGVSKLTEQELRTLGTTVAAAADKMRALGIDVPQKFQDIEKAAKGATSASEGWSSWLKSTTAILGAFGVSLGVGALVQFGKSLLANADALRKMADQTGIGTDGLQKLGYAAGQSGNDLDQVTTAISQMQNRLAGGDKSAVKAVRDLGLSLDYLKTLSPDEQFIAIGDAIQKIPDPMQRTQMAMDLFGKSGAQILPTLTGDLRKLTDQAKDAGAVLSEQAVKSLDQFGDRMTAATTRGKVFVSEVLNGVINDAGAFIDAMKRMAGATDDFAKSRVALTEAGKIRQTELVADPLFPLGMGIDDLIERARALKVQLKEAITIKSWEEVSRIMGEMGAKGELSSEQMKLIIKAAKDFGGAAAESDPMVQGMVRGLEQIAPAASKAGSWLDLSGKKLTEMRAALAALTPEQKLQIDQFKLLGQSAAEMAPLVHADVDVIEAYQKAQERVATATTKANSALQPFKDAMVNLASVGATFRDTLDTINGSVVEAVKFYLQAGRSQEELATAYGLTKAQVAAIDQQMKFDESVTKATDKSWGSLRNTVTLIRPVFSDLHEEMTGLSDTMRDDFVGPIEDSKSGLALLYARVLDLNVSIPSLNDATSNYATTAEELAAKTRLAREALHALREETRTVADAFKGLGPLMIQAFTGGGGLTGAIQGFATSITNDLFGPKGAFSGITAKISVMFGKDGIGGAIGKALGGFLPVIGALIGPAIEGIKKLFRSAEQEINPLRKAFVDAAGGLDQLRNKATAAGVTINALLSAKNAKQYEAAIKALNSAFEEHERDITRAKELMSEYGITIQETGQKWRDQQLNEQTKGLIDDYRIMVDVLGLSVPAATEKMAEKFNSFLATAQQVGFVVPAEMKPILEQMIKLGLLTDDQGNKYESLEDTGVTFAETFAESVDRLVDKFDEFLQRLGLIPAAINAIPDRTIRINYDVGNPPNIPAPPPSGSPTAAGYGAVGGLVTARGIQSFAGGGVVLPFRPRGRDTVPAMLTPGETVDQPGVKDAVVRELQSLRSELPRTIARAVRDEVQKVRRT